MAGGGRKEVKKSDDPGEVPAFSAESMQHNMRIVYYSRTFLSIIAGVMAGVLGLTGFAGFLCYFIIMLLASAAIVGKTAFNVSTYFDSWQRVVIDGLTQGLMSFVLFWTFAYDLVHIF